MSQMSAVILFKSKRAETAPERRRVSIPDLIRYLDRHLPRGIDASAADSCRYGGHCDRIVERELFDMFANDRTVFQAAVCSGKSRYQALIELRDSLMRLPEVRELLSDLSISRSSIIKGVHQRASEASWRVCFDTPAPSRPQCGVSKVLTSGSGTLAGA
jgi:hypothetical protein